ncbi:MAG: hypothetical protein M3P94_02330 [Chloroflexota bacterium]|nr:hypothetical protein [Chloroflexota bacterium]
MTNPATKGSLAEVDPVTQPADGMTGQAMGGHSAGKHQATIAQVPTRMVRTIIPT